MTILPKKTRGGAQGGGGGGQGEGATDQAAHFNIANQVRVGRGLVEGLGGARSHD